MILWRLLPWQRESPPGDPGGALWFPRELQGTGRHDNPDRYGCMYASELAISAVAEALAPFRGAGSLVPGMLVRAGAALALARIDLGGGGLIADAGEVADPGVDGTSAVAEGEGLLVDLDDPRTLQKSRLYPSVVATRRRSVTQAYAARLFDAQPNAVGLRWWSTLEASLINVTLFDRAGPHMSVVDIEELTVEHAAVREAAELLGLVVGHRV